jgi:hypothetical protein
MHSSISEFLIAFAGIIFLIFGGLIVFNDDFLAHMRRTTWSRREARGVFGKKFSEKESYSFDRYGTGLGFFVGGIILLTMLFIKLLK